MIGLGQVPSLGNTSNRLYELRLEKEVATVDDVEAEQGAIHTESVHLSLKERDSVPTYSRGGVTKKLSRLWLNLRPGKPVTKPEVDEEDDDPIAQARAQSLTGKNAPLGWLTLDNLVDFTTSLFKGDDKLVKEPDSLESPDGISLPFLQSDPDDDDYLFNQEWFLSPHG